MFAMSACGMLSNRSDEGSDATTEAQAVGQDIILVREDVNLDIMSVEERVDYYLTRYADDSSLGDKSIAESIRIEMMEWLQSLSDEDKRRADDASDEWYGKNANRI